VIKMSHMYPEGAPQGFEKQDKKPSEYEKIMEKQANCDHEPENREVNNETCTQCGAELQATETTEEDGHLTVTQWRVIG